MSPPRLRTVVPGLVLWLALGLTARALAGAAAPDTADTALDQLMGLLAQQRHAEADFEQRQYLAVLTEPLVSSGNLIYQAPDHLEQNTLRPHRQSLLLDHGMLTMQIGKRRHTVRLADYPQLAPLIDSIRATLAGDRVTLERLFRLQFSGTLDHWRVRLQPRDPQLAATLTAIDIQGEGATIREVQMRQNDGDHSVMHIQPRE